MKALRVGSLEWLRTLETTRGDKRLALQRVYVHSNRKAWITRIGPRQFSYSFAWKGDIQNSYSGRTRSLLLARCHIAGWLKDAHV